jgi:glucokinase
MAKRTTARLSRLRPSGAQNNAATNRRDACTVLRLLRGRDRDPAETMKGLSEFSGSRLSAAFAVLDGEGLVDYSGESKLKITRRPTLPRINPSYGHVIGVDVGGSNLRIALADLNGRIIGKWTASTRSTSSPKMVVKQIRKGVHDLLQQASIPHSSLLAVAAGAPGVTDRDAGVVFATSYLKGWKNVPLGRLLESALHVPAVVENDVKLAAIAENWIGVARGIPDFVFLAIGTGIAAGIFVNGQLVHGADWVAGEVGYLIVPGTPHMPARQGSPGSLESMIGGEGIRQYWLRSNGEQATNRTGDLSATGIFYHALAGNRRAKAVLEQSARILAFAVYNISTVLNSSLFVLGGGVGTNGPLLAATRRILEPYTQPSRPKLITSALGAEAQLIGAIRLALDRAESLIDSQLQ